MADMNIIVLAGRLTRDPQVRHLQSGTAVCEFGIAVERKWRNKDGQMQKETLFIDVNAWGGLGETIGKYMTKGRSILIRGVLRLNSWQDKEGNKHSKHTVVCDDCQFLDSKPNGESDNGGDQEEKPRRESFP